jgi:endonuclease YncB( thermonuclease family)
MRTIIVAFTALAASTTAALADPCEAPLPAKGTPFAGVVTYIVDGDGLCVGPLPDKAIEVRLADFNAPEWNREGGKEAKAALTRIAMGKHVECTAGEKTWDRTAARCTLDGRPLGDLMRAAGVPEGGN